MLYYKNLFKLAMPKSVVMLLVLCGLQYTALSQKLVDKRESVKYSNTKKMFNSIEIGGAYGRVDMSNPFMQGLNSKGVPIKNMSGVHAKYIRQFDYNSYEDIVYGSPYVGVGAFYSSFSHKKDIGNPWGIYFLQGAKIASITDRLALNYEWNFGISAGWHPYDKKNNPFNGVVGTKLNAYIDVNFFMAFMLNKYIDFNVGISASHFSNGNTKVPNVGINTLLGYVGVRSYFNRDDQFSYSKKANPYKYLFDKKMKYEFLFYAAWKDMIIDTSGTILESPYLNKKLSVFGMTFSSLYSVSPKVNLGGSIDISYDESAGMRYVIQNSNTLLLERAKFGNQISVGLAGRVDFVMPFVVLSGSLGYDIAHADKKTNAFYQILSVKFNVTKSIFFNVGYKVRSFSHPDNLILGLGFTI